MRIFLALSITLLPSLILAQGTHDSIKSLVKKLGSPNSAERRAATEALKNCPEAAADLRDASRSPDPEVAGRAALILEYLEDRPGRDLQAAIKKGDLERAIRLAADWPNGRKEAQVYSAVRQLVHALDELNRKQKGHKSKLDLAWLDTPEPPVVISAKRIVEALRVEEAGRLKNEVMKTERSRNFFLRGADVELDDSGNKRAIVSQLYFPGNLIVASGSVRIRKSVGMVCILAGGDVEVTTSDQMLIVSCGNVTVTGNTSDSLIVAKGNTTCAAYLINSRIISGKTIEYQKTATRDSSIHEKEPNPFGYIRWNPSPDFLRPGNQDWP